MDYRKNKIGKIKSYDYKYGVGSVIDSQNTYIFTINDIKEDILPGDLVRFRGEKINDEYKASFIKKINNIDEENDNCEIIQAKKYYSNNMKENDSNN